MEIFNLLYTVVDTGRRFVQKETVIELSSRVALTKIYPVTLATIWCFCEKLKKINLIREFDLTEKFDPNQVLNLLTKVFFLVRIAIWILIMVMLLTIVSKKQSGHHKKKVQSF